jgi:phosphorylcholine metabolism protein LicD
MPLPDKERQKALTYLVQSYFSTMNDIGIQTWIMHGTLMGWWWNRKILPWDSDLDVMIAESSMRYLSDYYNMTVHHFAFPDEPQGRDYLLEVNPYWVNSSTADKLNSIDARWIDMDAGLFIDITTLRPNTTAEAQGIKGMMMCKDKHHYRHKDIFPLRDTVFENILVKIPYAYADLLEEEYGPASLTRTRFANHHFESEIMEWIPDPLVHHSRPHPGGPGSRWRPNR